LVIVTAILDRPSWFPGAMISSQSLNTSNRVALRDVLPLILNFALFIAVLFTRIRNQTVTPSDRLCYGARVLLVICA